MFMTIQKSDDFLFVLQVLKWALLLVLQGRKHFSQCIVFFHRSSTYLSDEINAGLPLMAIKIQGVE